jgi:FixJ family two-component response regulator
MEAGDTRVFVVDDDPSVRGSLARLLGSAGWIVEAFASAQEFLERPPFHGTGCVVLDVQMPGMRGPELYRMMRDAGLTLPVVYLTGHGDVTTGVDAMKRGAMDFLLKTVDSEVLLETIRRAIEKHATARVRESEKRAIQARLQRLSRREHEVLEHLLRGRLNKQIAADLGIALQTVKRHRGQVMEKMEARSVAELIGQCTTAGIPSGGTSSSSFN